MIPIESLLGLAQTSMTDFQLDRFVTIRSGGTLYGCLFQALRELHKRYRGLIGLYFERRTWKLKIVRMGIAAEADTLRGELAAVKAEQYRFAASECDRAIATTEREFLRFYGQSAALWVALGFDREAPTPDRLAALEAERWEHHVRCMLALDMLTGGRPGRNTAELLQALEPAMRKRLGDELRNPDALIRWYFDYAPGLPEPLALSEEESRRLLACCESSRLPRLSQSSLATAASESRATSTRSGSRSASHASDALACGAACAAAGSQ